MIFSAVLPKSLTICFSYASHPLEVLQDRQLTSTAQHNQSRSESLRWIYVVFVFVVMSCVFVSPMMQIHVWMRKWRDGPSDSWGIAAEVYFHGTVNSNYLVRFLPKQAWERCRQPCAPSLIRLEKVTADIKRLWLRELCPVNTQEDKRRHWWRLKSMKCKAMVLKKGCSKVRISYLSVLEFKFELNWTLPTRR